MSAHMTPEQVRSKIDHPIVDGDGHWVEYDPVFSEKMRKVGSDLAADGFLKAMGVTREALTMCRNLDYEVELAVWIGSGNELGEPIRSGRRRAGRPARRSPSRDRYSGWRIRRRATGQAGRRASHSFHSPLYSLLCGTSPQLSLVHSGYSYHCWLTNGLSAIRTICRSRSSWHSSRLSCREISQNSYVCQMRQTMTPRPASRKSAIRT